MFFAVGFVAVREPTVRPRTALGRVVRSDLFDGDATFWGLVLNVLEQTSERLYVMPLRLWKPLAGIC